METLQDFYTFQGIPLVFALIVVILTLTACVGTIYRHHHQATEALKQQYKEYKDHMGTKAKERKEKVAQKYKPGTTNEKQPAKSDKKTPKDNDPSEEKQFRLRNEIVEKATINAIMQVIGYLGIGFLLLTLIATVF